MSHRRARAGVVIGELISLKFSDRALDFSDQSFVLVVGNHRADIATLLLGVDFRKRGRTHPAFKVGSNVIQELRPLRRVCRQNGEISMVAIEIFDRPAMGLEETAIIGEQESALFLVHFNDGTLELWKRIEDLSRLCCHLLFACALTQKDLLFIF